MTAHSASLDIDSCQSVIPHDIEVHECTAARAAYASTEVLVQHVHLQSRYSVLPAETTSESNRTCPHMGAGGPIDCIASLPSARPQPLEMRRLQRRSER
jgi:hypothetical protein